MLTTPDWLARIGTAPLDECLDGAEAAAERADDWNAIAAACAGQGRVGAARSAVARAIEVAHGEHWPCRRAAEQLLALGDRDGARAAIAAIEAAAPKQAYQWILLAKAYREVLADDDAVARCLARAPADTIDDLAALAAGHVELVGDRARAIELLERAEADAFARGELRALWDVANRWHGSLDEVARARDVLAAATAAATDADTTCWLAIAWGSLFGDEDAIRAALARGEALAITPADWLALAEAYRDGGDGNREDAWDRDAVRRCLDAATAAQPSDAERARIAAGLRRWLGDDVPDPAVAAPAAARTLPGWAIDERALFDRVRERVSAGVIDQIAGADYGCEVPKHRAGLIEIQRTGRIEAPMPWNPHEVLALTRWSEGEATDHVARAFACVALALEHTMPASHHNSDLQSLLPQLIESAWLLELVDELHAFLAWLATTAPYDADAAWAIVGLVLSAAQRDATDPRLAALIDRLEADPWVQADLARDLKESIVRRAWIAQIDRGFAALDPAPRDRLAALFGRLRRPP